MSPVPISNEYLDGTIDRTYTWGLDVSGSVQGAGGVGGLLAVTNAKTTEHYYATFDGSGNVSEYLDGQGAIYASYEYDAFGNNIATRNVGDSYFEHRFSTKMIDGDTGLYFYGFRYYDPSVGRWISRDPIAEIGGINLYGFIDNSVYDHVDYLGMEPVTLTGLAAAALVVAEVAGTVADVYTGIDMARNGATPGEWIGYGGGVAIGLVTPGSWGWLTRNLDELPISRIFPRKKPTNNDPPKKRRDDDDGGGGSPRCFKLTNRLKSYCLREVVNSSGDFVCIRYACGYNCKCKKDKCKCSRTGCEKHGGSVKRIINGTVDDLVGPKQCPAPASVALTVKCKANGHCCHGLGLQ